MRRILERYFPFLVWLRTYDLPTFKLELTAGCTVALVPELSAQQKELAKGDG